MMKKIGTIHSETEVLTLCNQCQCYIELGGMCDYSCKYDGLEIDERDNDIMSLVRVKHSSEILDVQPYK